MSDRFGPIRQVDERQLRLLVRDWRHGRADRSLLQALSDAYVMVFAVILIGAMLVSSVMQAQRLSATCDSAECLASRSLIPWAAVAACLAFALVLARMFGPILASAAEGFWLLEGTVDRRRLLKWRLFGAVTIALLVGAGLGAIFAVLVGSGGAVILTWALAAGLGCFGLVALAAAEQGDERRWLVTLLVWLTGAVAFVALGLLVVISAGAVAPGPIATLGLEFAYVIAGAGTVLGLVATALAWSRMNKIRRQRLVAGGSLVAGMQGAAFALDLALVRDILVEARARARGHVRPTRGVGRGVTALIMRDVQRLWRDPKPLVFWLGSMLVPYALQALGVGQLSPPLSALVLMGALIGFCNSLRVLTRTKGLQRCLPFGPGQIRQAAMVVPGLLAALWGLAVTPAFLGLLGGKSVDIGVGLTASLITAAAGLLAAVRWVTAKPANYGGPLVATTGFGALPPGLLFALFKGIDIVALVTLPLVLGLPSWVSLVIAAISFMVLRSGMDQQSLLEQSEEQRRLLDEEKAKRAGLGGTKIKVQRKR